MITECQDDFRWLLRSRSGYYPWLVKRPHEFYRYHHRHCPMCDREPSANNLLVEAMEHALVCHPLLDIFLKALIRAEARLISRYIPQRSNEERLTGHLVSETDNSISVLRERFQRESQKRYAEKREIDFLYYDLSRGGRIEKTTGADLGFIVVVDLPDYPYLVKSFVFQAKKINGHCQLDVTQCRTLAKNDTTAAYLFYHMNPQTRTAPMVLPLTDHTLNKNFEETEKTKAKTFTLCFDDVLDGTPFSLYVIREIEKLETGNVFADFREALQFFRSMANPNLENQRPFDGILGIVSLGRRITFQPNSDFGLEVTV